MDNKNLYIYKDGGYHKAAGLAPEQVLALIRPLLSTEIKVGFYVMNEDSTKYEYFGEDVPEDFTGHAILISDDGLWYFENYVHGEVTHFTELNGGGMNVTDGENNVYATFSSDGASKLNFGALTHSFNELDNTLKQIVEDAIDDAGTNGVACTQVQWNAIKELLDESLYIKYFDYSLIKAFTNELNDYCFGGVLSGNSNLSGAETLRLRYESADELLYGSFSEI